MIPKQEFETQKCDGQTPHAGRANSRVKVEIVKYLDNMVKHTKMIYFAILSIVNATIRFLQNQIFLIEAVNLAGVGYPQYFALDSDHKKPTFSKSRRNFPISDTITKSHISIAPWQFQHFWWMQ